MTANMNDCCPFFDITKPASICNNKKCQNHENDLLQIAILPLTNSNTATYQGVDFTLPFEYPYFFGGQNSAANSAIGSSLGFSEETLRNECRKYG